MSRLWRLLWIATTPLALTFLLAAPSARGQDEPIRHVRNEMNAGDEGETAEGAEHHAGNPIVNLVDFGYKGEKTEEGEPKPPPFAAALLNFAVLAFLVGKYAGPTLKRFVRDRHEGIAHALDEAAKLRDEARARLDEYQKKLAALEAEVEGLLARTREEAAAERARILADAEAQAARIRHDAELQAKADLERTRAAIEREVGLAALTAAERLLRERTGEPDHRGLVDQFVSGLEAGLKSSGGRPLTGGRVA